MPGAGQRCSQALSDTAVTMRTITPAEAAAYWDSGEPAGKAGGYAIQGLGALFIEHIDGSYSGVMGLPLYETAQLLQSHGLYGVPPDEHRDTGECDAARDRAPHCSRTAPCRSCSSSAPAVAGWSAISTRAACRACCRACRPRFSTSAWRARPSCTWPISWRPPPDPANDAQQEPGSQDVDIRTLVREGDDLLVQVVKDPLGTKGARLSTHVSLPSRYLVYMPRGARVGRVGAHRIRGRAQPPARTGDDAGARARRRQRRARRLHRAHRGTGRAAGSAACRHAVPAAHVGACARALRRRPPAGNLVHEDLPLSTRVLRDELRPEVRRVLVDSPDGVRAHARVHRVLHAGVHRSHRAAPGAAPDLRPAWHRGRDQSRAGCSACR